MDDDSSFKLRVEKVFGSLSSWSSSASSMWSLTDEEIEKKEWNRDLNRLDDDDDDERILPCNSKDPAFFSQSQEEEEEAAAAPSSSELKSDLHNLHGEEEHDDDDDGEEQASPAASKRAMKHRMRLSLSHREENEDEGELDVRSSIGLDSTLDYEEEEDEYDKVALGKEKEMEKAGRDYLFMKDVTNYSIDVHTYHELPDSFDAHLTKDPRANHLAAKLRLKEDTDAAGNFHSLNLSDDKSQITTPTPTHTHTPTDEHDSLIPKPILKKRHTHLPSKSNKRVRFDAHFDDSIDTIPHVTAIDPSSAHPPPNEGSRPNLPDYLRNPSKYTCYTLDSSSDMDDESNCRAYMDFLNLIKKPTTPTTTTTTTNDTDTDTVDSSKPPTFISRKPPTVKRENDCKQNQGDVYQVKTPPPPPPPRIGIAAGDDQNSEANPMEEDEPGGGVDKSMRKSGRRYRARMVIDSEQHCVT